MNRLLFALRRGSALIPAAILGTLLVACAPSDGGSTATGGGAADGGSETATVENGAVEITADNLEFSAATIEATAGEAFTITLVNNDSAPHNLSVYTEEGGEEIVAGDVIEGGQTTEVEVPALDAGEYFFVCDIHPDMTGTVVVAEG
jgi:plastocyanin